MSFTITVTSTGTQTAAPGVTFDTKVYTGATEYANGAVATNQTASGTANTVSMTPKSGSSQIVWASSDGSSLTNGMIAATNNTTYEAFGGVAGDNAAFVFGHYTGTVTSGSAVTVGATMNTSGDSRTLSAFEILSTSGSTTPVLDGSSPAQVNATSASSGTTASFNPPAGSVIAVLVVIGGTNNTGTVGCTISDTSGLGLVWTQRAAVSHTLTGIDCFSCIFTTTVPPTATFTPIGLPIDGAGTGATTITTGTTNFTAGNVVIAFTTGNLSGNTGPATCTAMSGGNCNWTQLSGNFSNPVGGVPAHVTCNAWLGIVTSTGSSTVTGTFTGAESTNARIDVQEFFIGRPGYISVDTQAGIDQSSGSSALPSLTPSRAGDMYIAFDYDGATATAGATSGYTYYLTTGGNAIVCNTNCSASTQSPTMGDTTVEAGMAMMLSLSQALTGSYSYKPGRTQKNKLAKRRQQLPMQPIIAVVVIPNGTVPAPYMPPRRKSARAVLGGNGFCADGTVGSPQPNRPPIQLTNLVVLPRRTKARANVGPFSTLWSFIHGVQQPNAPPRESTVMAIPPRRKASRAVLGGNGFCADGVIGPVLPYGSVQSRATLGVQPRRKTYRAVVANKSAPVNQYGTLQDRTTVPVPRRYPSRALWHGVAGSIIAPGVAQPVPTRQPRRTTARALIKYSQVYETEAGPILPYGQIQPRATVPVPRRYPSRAGKWEGFAAPTGVYGKTQPRASVPVPRRYSSRQGKWLSSTGSVFTGVFVNGTVQPEATFPQQRRKTYRVFYHGGAGQVFVPPPPGTIQPWPTIPVPRRKTSRSLSHGVSGQIQAPGHIEPQWMAVPPRRKNTRAYTRNIAGKVQAPGKVQPLATRQPRRTTYRAVVRGFAAVVYGRGTIQPRASVPIPRKRGRARLYDWAGGKGAALVFLPGTVQPRATVPIPRRYPSRAFTCVPKHAVGGLFTPSPSGTAQPRATVPVPRRYPSRAGKWLSIAGKTGVYGSTQPSATRQPRRTAYRAVVRWFAAFIPGYGRTQARATVPVPRRYPSRQGTWASTTGRAQAGFGKIQPRATLPPRRTSARAVIRSFAAPIAVHGKLQPVSTFPVPRRKTSRAVTLHSAGAIQTFGKTQPVATRLARRATYRAVVSGFASYIQRHYTIQQPRATVPVPRRVISRALVRSVQAPAPVRLFPQPTATRLPRRNTARAVVRSVSGFPQVPARQQPRATVPVSRRTRARGFWFIQQGPQPATAEASPAKERFNIPRRVKTRSNWRKIHGRFLLTSTVETVSFNVYVEYTSTVTIAFNVDIAQPERTGLATGLPWLSPYDASRRMSSDPLSPFYDGKIRMSEDPKGYMQGGDRGD
jgi:hypothetical protein